MIHSFLRIERLTHVITFFPLASEVGLLAIVDWTRVET